MKVYLFYYFIIGFFLIWIYWEILYNIIFIYIKIKVINWLVLNGFLKIKIFKINMIVGFIYWMKLVNDNGICLVFVENRINGIVVIVFENSS